MMLKYYRVRIVNNDLRASCVEKGEPTCYQFVARDLPSAWRKFVRLHFRGPLLPCPEDYDVSYIGTYNIERSVWT